MMQVAAGNTDMQSANVVQTTAANVSNPVATGGTMQPALLSHLTNSTHMKHC